MSAVASGQVIASATYFDLRGSWDGTLFRANAEALPGMNSSGSIARTVAPIGTADFEPGFVAGASPADFRLTLDFVGMGPGVGSGTGSFIVTDADGDTVSGNISGTWIDGGSQVFFNGAMSNVVFTGTSFDGTSSGSFSTLFGGSGVYDGAVTQLFLSPPGNFFATPFDMVSTGATMQILPAPGAAALLGLGGLVVARRRR
ncbi:MAG: hypothetical protein SFY69_12025 [Planctomycetota bacterium]|nr:hypothetical protein [Planctomycetota bacterium]